MGYNAVKIAGIIGSIISGHRNLTLLLEGFSNMKAKMVWLLSFACWSGVDFSLGEMLPRVADYNIKFLSVEDLDAKPKRKQRLRTVIESLKPDILALQEIKDGQALEQLFDSDEWSILIHDDSKDAQDLAIVVRRHSNSRTAQANQATRRSLANNHRSQSGKEPWSR